MPTRRKRVFLSQRLETDSNTAFDSFHTIITDIIKKSKINIKIKGRNKPKKVWTSQLTVRLHNKKNKYRKIYIRNPTPTNYVNFIEAEREFKSSFNKDSKTYYTNRLLEAGNNSKKIWSVIDEALNRKLNDYHQKIDYITDNGSEIKDPTEICKGFNTYYKNVAFNIAKDIPQPQLSYSTYLHNNKKPTTKFKFKTINENDITETVKSFRSKLSRGFDELSPKTLKIITPLIAKPLKICLNKSFTSGQFPDKLKLSKITPLLKKPPTDLYGNYRPIAQNSSLSKLYESISGSQLYDYLNNEQIIPANQFGFKKGHSTNHALIVRI